MAATLQPPQWSCTSVVDDDGVLIQPGGELDLATVSELNDAISSAIAARMPTIVDLTGLTFIDSTGLVCFLTAAQAAREAGIVLELVPGDAPAMRLFELT